MITVRYIRFFLLAILGFISTANAGRIEMILNERNVAAITSWANSFMGFDRNAFEEIAGNNLCRKFGFEGVSEKPESLKLTAVFETRLNLPLIETKKDGLKEASFEKYSLALQKPWRYVSKQNLRRLICSRYGQFYGIVGIVLTSHSLSILLNSAFNGYWSNTHTAGAFYLTIPTFLTYNYFVRTPAHGKKHVQRVTDRLQTEGISAIPHSNPECDCCSDCLYLMIATDEQKKELPHLKFGKLRCIGNEEELNQYSWFQKYKNQQEGKDPLFRSPFVLEKSSEEKYESPLSDYSLPKNPKPQVKIMADPEPLVTKQKQKIKTRKETLALENDQVLTENVSEMAPPKQDSIRICRESLSSSSRNFIGNILSKNTTMVELPKFLKFFDELGITVKKNKSGYAIWGSVIVGEVKPHMESFHLSAFNSDRPDIVTLLKNFIESDEGIMKQLKDAEVL